MKLPMSDGEIARRYRNALDPKKAVKILAQLNAARTSDITAALARAGITPVQPHPRKIPKRLNQKLAQELYNQGLDDKEIAEITGTSDTAVYHWRYRNGLPSHAKNHRRDGEGDGVQAQKGVMPHDISGH